MVVKKRPLHGGDSESDSDSGSDSDSDCFEIRQAGQAPPPSSSVNHHNVSGTDARLRRRKQLKASTTFVSSSVSKMIWSKNDELVILGSIVDYEKETKSSYRSDWDAFYGYIKNFIATNFSKKQLIDKIRSLKKRFDNNIARSHDGKGPSFVNTDDDEIFKLSMIIWSTNVTECASNENIDHAKVLDLNKDVEHEQVNENLDQEKVDVPCVEVNANMDQEKVNEDVPCVRHERVNENMEQKNVARDEPVSEHEPVSNTSMEINNGEKEKSEEDGVDEFDALHDALEETTLFQSSSKYQQKKLFQNLKNLGAQRRKELADEWKALLAEELQLYARKLTFAAKLANAGISS